MFAISNRVIRNGAVKKIVCEELEVGQKGAMEVSKGRVFLGKRKASTKCSCFEGLEKKCINEMLFS